MVAASARPRKKIVERVYNQLLLLISLAKGLVANMSSLPDNIGCNLNLTSNVFPSPVCPQPIFGLTPDIRLQLSGMNFGNRPGFQTR